MNITRKQFFVIILVVFIVSFIAGLNIGARSTRVENLWDREREGLGKLNDLMRNDKSQRLGMVIITELKTYGIQSISSEEYQVYGGFRDKQGNPVTME